MNVSISLDWGSSRDRRSPERLTPAAFLSLSKPTALKPKTAAPGVDERQVRSREDLRADERMTKEAQ